MNGAPANRLALAAALVVALVTTASAAEGPPASYRKIADRKAAIAEALVEPVAACVARHDTGYAAFHGCVDWHSAVHGTWALIAYERATGDRRHERLVRQALTDANIAAERQVLRAQPAFEMPYGRSWFLRLAIDYEKQFADGRLAAMAAEVAASLLRRFADAPANPDAGAYDSDSWALLNLLDYAEFTRDDAMKTTVAGIVKRDFVAGTAPCPAGSEAGEFMAICTNRAALVGRVMAPAAFRDWVASFFSRAPRALEPVVAPATAHENGLDFSRAWGLAEIYRETGDPRFADAFAAHFDAGFSVAAQWNGPYRTVAHWVAQFGMYALQPLFGPAKGR